jgi:hypothetical protein
MTDNGLFEGDLTSEPYQHPAMGVWRAKIRIHFMGSKAIDVFDPNDTRIITSSNKQRGDMWVDIVHPEFRIIRRLSPYHYVEVAAMHTLEELKLMLGDAE